MKIRLHYLFFFILILFFLYSCKQNRFQPNWKSLEQVNPAPEWFKDAKFGIYFHWGVYSVPAFGNEWYPRNMFNAGSNENKHHTETYGNPKDWPYHFFITGAKDLKGNSIQFAPKLKSEGGQFDPDEWAQFFSDAGARFAGPVAEHHDGFSMWASKVNPWNAKDMGPKLDLVKLLTDAIRKKNMNVFLSMHHAFNITGYYEFVPKTNDPKLQILYGQQSKEKNEQLWLDKHKEIIDQYQPDIIYQDFNLSKIDEKYHLEFLSYYYNKADEWNKEVVTTYKDEYNKKCSMLDFERGGPADLTDYYWLTDDAISSSSWCYTEGISYYSKTALLHALIDRVSKNGNMILNISPRPDGSIPQGQKDILLAMGAWLKKYGEAIYSTRAWVKYGEGSTKMGAGHGVFTAPQEGKPDDIRFTRSKDNTILYAILLAWPGDQTKFTIKSLATTRIHLQSLKEVSLLAPAGSKNIPLAFFQDSTGLHITLPVKPLEEMAYVIKLSYKGQIPTYDNYFELNETEKYYTIVSKENMGLKVNNTDSKGAVNFSSDKKNHAQQWKFVKTGKGFYKIQNRKDSQLVLECTENTDKSMIVHLANYSSADNQQWKLVNADDGFYYILNKKYTNYGLDFTGPPSKITRIESKKFDKDKSHKWALMDVCEKIRTPFKPNIIPGTIEAEDYDNGCPDEVYFDSDPQCSGGEYRTENGVDIEKCIKGGYNVGWTATGEWLEYTVNVKHSGTYSLNIHTASGSNGNKLHIEFDGIDKTGPVVINTTGGIQVWKIISKTFKLTEGKHIMKVFFDVAPGGCNLDKFDFVYNKH